MKKNLNRETNLKWKRVKMKEWCKKKSREGKNRVKMQELFLKNSGKK